MCTVTIHRDAETLVVTMNRDEARTRAPESPPAIFAPEDFAKEWMAPIDGEAGGTWMGVNARGVVACLLNVYRPGQMLARPEAPSAFSRGTIVPAVLAQGDGERVRRWITEKFDPSPYESFQLVVVWLEGGARWVWSDSEHLEHSPCRDEWTLVSSSLWRPDAVLAWRREAFEQWRNAGSERRGHLPAFHLLQAKGKEEWSPLMDREWSCTRSITQAHVDGRTRRSVLRYWPRTTRGTVAVAPASELYLAMPAGY